MTRRRAMTVAPLTLLIGIAIPSCVKDTTFNPYAAPDNGELDRLQKIVNERPDLEVAHQQLASLDDQIGTTINRFSPQTVIGSSTPSPTEAVPTPMATTSATRPPSRRSTRVLPPSTRSSTTSPRRCSQSSTQRGSHPTLPPT